MKSKSRFVLAVKNLLRNWVRIPQLYVEWQAVRRLEPVPTTRALASVLLVPADPSHLVGSKGDEAMISGVVTRIRDSHPDCRFGILTNLPRLPASLSPLGIEAECRWSNPWSLCALANIILRYDAVLVTGADNLDGHYSPVSAARYWVVADVAARLGKLAVVLGFSFNSRPSNWLRPFLNRLSPQLTIFARDAVSLERFNAFSRARAELVADTAFLLAPGGDNATVKSIADWCTRQRGMGRMICGFNIHPMLLKDAGPEQIERLVETSAKALALLLRERPLSVVLISHDYRGPGLGDCEVLAAIGKKLQEGGATNVLHFDERLHAAELKAVAGLMDLVVTGRMHLAIAALGQGVPVAGITYQGKFHGLLQHFELPEQLLMAPEELADNAVFARWMLAALDQQPTLKAQVERRLPAVKERAQKNLSPLTEWSRRHEH